MGSWKSLKIDSGTGWKEIYRDAGSGGWKALEWQSAVDVGSACSNRTSSLELAGYTSISVTNPANASGTLTSICVYVAATVGSDWHVGVFDFISGTTFKCRSAANLGALSVGENNETVSLTIETGDYIGLYSSANEFIEKDVTGSLGVYYILENQCVVDSEIPYSHVTPMQISIYGTG